MATREEALAKLRALRAQIDAVIAATADSPEIINALPDGIRPWTQGAYAVGDVRMWNGIPRKCVTAHDSTGSPDWTPAVGSLWMQYHGTSPVSARPYVPPTGGHDVYRLGEYMTYGGVIYTPAIDNMAYSPSQYGAGWTAVGDLL